MLSSFFGGLNPHRPFAGTDAWPRIDLCNEDGLEWRLDITGDFSRGKINVVNVYQDLEFGTISAIHVFHEGGTMMGAGWFVDEIQIAYRIRAEEYGDPPGEELKDMIVTDTFVVDAWIENYSWSGRKTRLETVDRDMTEVPRQRPLGVNDERTNMRETGLPSLDLNSGIQKHTGHGRSRAKKELDAPRINDNFFLRPGINIFVERPHGYEEPVPSPFENEHGRGKSDINSGEPGTLVIADQGPSCAVSRKEKVNGATRTFIDAISSDSGALDQAFLNRVMSAYDSLRMASRSDGFDVDENWNRYLQTNVDRLHQQLQEEHSAACAESEASCEGESGRIVSTDVLEERGEWQYVKQTAIDGTISSYFYNTVTLESQWLKEGTSFD